MLALLPARDISRVLEPSNRPWFDANFNFGSTEPIRSSIGSTRQKSFQLLIKSRLYREVQRRATTPA
jgi:hypothetical protein